MRWIADQLRRARLATLTQFNRPRDAIVINGFWRSGTTWLQELLAATLRRRCVFEPFEATNPWMIDAAIRIGLPSLELPFRNAFMPCATQAFSSSDPVGQIVARALTGRLRSGFDVGLERRRPALGHRIVAKFTRASLCLPAISLTHDVPIIHIYRDPSTVLTSVLAVPGWGRGAFTDLALRQQLLEAPDGRAVHFRHWESTIDRWDRKGPVERVAAYYCLTEWFVEEVAAPRLAGRNFVLLRYEDLKRDPSAALGPLIRRFGGDAGLLDQGLAARRSVTDRRARSSGSSAAGKTYPSTREIRDAVSAALRDFSLEHRRVE